MCVHLSSILRSTIESFYRGEEDGEESLLRVRVSSDEGLLYRPCSSNYKGDINLIHLTPPEFPSPRNICIFTPLCPGAQSLDGLQETKICCFRLSAQVHSCNFAEITGVCTYFYIKYKVGFLRSDFLHQKLSIWSKLLNRQALVIALEGERQPQKATHPVLQEGHAAPLDVPPHFCWPPKGLVTKVHSSHTAGHGVKRDESVSISLLTTSTPRRYRKLIPS